MDCTTAHINTVAGAMDIVADPDYDTILKL
jgi:hypothetical protein